MQNNNLRSLLEDLYTELTKTSTDSSDLEDKKTSLAGYIHTTLEQDDLNESHSSLDSVFNEAIISFEESHPKITQLINNVINMLSSAGI